MKCAINGTTVTPVKVLHELRLKFELNDGLPLLGSDGLRDGLCYSLLYSVVLCLGDNAQATNHSLELLQVFLVLNPG